MTKGLTKRQKRQIFSLILIILLAFASRYLPQSTKQTAENTITKTERIAKNDQPGLYTVNKFIDGDTIKVNMDGQVKTIRFIGVDTPEEYDSRKNVQCFAKAAAQYTKSLIDHGKVRLKTDPLSDNRDRYGRLLRYIYTPSGLLVNKQIVAGGYGFTIQAFPFTKMDEFNAAQKKAKQNNKGLWGTCQVSYSTGYPQTNAIGPPPKYSN